ncbi:hypothetical protein GUITHDRAFT_166405 [Guillardia theta CCMP2712]|uniref:ER membrane protein complex subunit 4 n=1 Tax=Guillardia theta (strain CCMP2712) TaxID=905079 RepID=L1IC60_GUITC|nr:hypothetical protein GUITHDRAFT_166405 [Guillardia theta CCMP2712]EKX33687.1 hypothetical protein GUITHDRAFT_166405 [Guillardia theta CCMP2712]|eukprot:XP_005820667.1 hypothetical protein GUITHDRAFT_166405 [Guillardia theta CCMP2712]
MAPNFPSRRWVFGVDGLPRSERNALTVSGAIEPTGQLEPREDSAQVKKVITIEKKREFIEKRAWDVALQPGKQFMMTGVGFKAFMMWMMGSGVHIMNIIFTFYQLMGPIRGLMSIGPAFKAIEETAKELRVDLLIHKLVFIACQLGVLLYITNRFGSMGLLPTSAGDWLTTVKVKYPEEFSTGGFPM